MSLQNGSVVTPELKVLCVVLLQFLADHREMQYIASRIVTGKMPLETEIDSSVWRRLTHALNDAIWYLKRHQRHTEVYFLRPDADQRINLSQGFCFERGMPILIKEAKGSGIASALLSDEMFISHNFFRAEEVIGPGSMESP